MTSREFRERFHRRAKRADLRLTDAQVEAVEAYFTQLSTWNAKINLTGFDLSKDLDVAFDRLLIEPLIAARFIPADARTLLDVGSGGGSPALLLKVARPELLLRMVESKTRKCVFLKEAARSMGLDGTEAIPARLEALLSEPRMHEWADVGSVRAVRVEAKFLSALQAFVAEGGRILLFTTGSPSDVPSNPHPLLSSLGSYPLIGANGSSVSILERRRVGGR